MKLQLEMLRDVPDAKYLQADVAEMEHMVEGYLAFASGEGRETPAPTDLGGLLGDEAGQRARHGRTGDLPEEQHPTLPLRPDVNRRCPPNMTHTAPSPGTPPALTASRR